MTTHGLTEDVATIDNPLLGQAVSFPLWTLRVSLETWVVGKEDETIRSKLI